jgi:hypothetical protein
MNNKTYVRGVIGYSILKSKQIKLILIADMHEINNNCGDENISDWLQRQKDFKILIEEVPENNYNIVELYSNSIHTKKLRELYLNNLNNIVGLDIRGELLDFSWELLDKMNFPEILFSDYLKNLDDFFSFKHKYFIKTVPKIYNENILKDNNSKLGQHFNICLDTYNNLKKNNLNITVQDMYKNNKNILENINLLINQIMEFYTIIEIYSLALKKHKNFIVYMGLFHTSNIIKLLIQLYNFELINSNGLTDFDKVNTIDHNGCYYLF